jgi:D-alanyl-D-alanine carboxypeptidase
VRRPGGTATGGSTIDPVDGSFVTETGWTQLQPLGEPQLAAIEAVNAELQQLSEVAPASMAIARHGQPIATRTVGTDITGQPLATDTPFRVASVSKVATMATVLALFDADIVDLDVPLALQWPLPAAPGDERFGAITPRHLLQHRSGLSAMRPTFFGGESANWHDSALAAVRASLGSDPGTAFRYSNANFVLLGELIEAASGLTYEQAVRTLVLEPLGITSARLRRTAEFPAGCPSYQITLDRTYMEALGPAGAWEMSAVDATRLVAAVQPTAARQLLTPASVAAARQPMDVPSPDADWTYGLGLMLFGDRWGHTGTIESVSAFVLNMPNGYTLAVLAGRELNSGEGLIRRFAGSLDEVARLSA